jgi:hypothetical protein
MSQPSPRSLIGRFRSLGRRDRAGPVAEARIDPPPAGPEAEETPVWSMVANVIDERPFGPGGEERRQGLKIFAPGAKVYVVGGFAGMAYDVVTVVGRGRKASRFVTAHVRTEHLVNWRVELVYSPAVLRRIAEGDHHRWPLASGDPATEEYRFELLDLAKELSRRQALD